MDLRVLGSLEVRSGTERITVPGGHHQRVLAALLLSANTTVPVSRLVAVSWDDDPPATAAKQVRNRVSALRDRLGEHRGMIVTDESGYRLVVDTADLDMLRFHRDHEAARRWAARGDHRAAVSAMRAALRWWRGPVLDGLDVHALTGPVTRLNEQRLHAVELCADWQLALGDHRAVVEELTEVIAQHPLRETAHARLMLALDRSGRQADALAVFHAMRARLVEELGVEPGDELRAVHARILHHAPPEPSGSRGATVAPDPAGAEEDWVGLRPHLNRLVGRVDESNRLRALIDRERLITVTGVGGCGKTALAISVAHEAARRGRTAGVALALAPVTSIEQAVHALAALLGVGDGGDGLDGAITAVRRALASGPRLLVLDNCEHLAGQVADLVTGLLTTCPELRVLATSRQPLSVPGECVFALEPLPLPVPGDPDRTVLAVPSVELFVDRVRQAGPSVPMTSAEVHHIAELCRRLDGLPLALELVAARVRAFPLRELVDRVDHDLTLLFRTSSSGDARHSSLEMTLDWSFQLLPPDQRRLLARMSVFATGFAATDAETVCGFAPLRHDMVAAQLAALVDRSLVQPYDAAGTRRYRLLNVIRTFAAARLADFGETDTTASHHLGRWLALARHVDRLPRYDERVREWRAMEPYAANLRQCLQFGLDTGHALDAAEIVATAFEFWLVNKGHLTEGRVWLQRVLALPDLSTRPDIHALLRFHQGLVVKMFDDNPRGQALLVSVVDDLATHGRREHLEARAGVLNSKMIALDPSVLDDVEPAVAAALAWPHADDARMVFNAAVSTMNTWGRYRRALDIATTRAPQAAGLTGSSAAAKLTVTIEALLGLGDLSRAAPLVDELVDQLGDVTHAAEQAAPRRVIATYYLVDRQPDRARYFLDEALTTLNAARPPLISRFVPLQILLAEAQRQCAHTATARHTLSDVLLLAHGRSSVKHTFAAPLCTALVAADVGEADVSRSLLTRWDHARRRGCLPVPVGFVAPARAAGLDPEPADRSASPWNPAALTACLDAATAWCAWPAGQEALLAREPGGGAPPGGR